MAIKVGGTTVIDNDRQLSNIGSFDSTTTTALNSAVTSDPTLATLTKSFTANEAASITLSSAVNTAPVVGVLKEQASEVGATTKGNWDVDSTASNYDLHNTAPATSITPSSATADGTFTLGSGSFSSTDVGKRVVGNGGVATITATDGSYTLETNFNDTSAIASGNWYLYGLDVTSSGLTINEYQASVNGVDISSLSYDGSTYDKDVSSYTGGCYDVFMKPDGTKMWTVGYSQTTIAEWDLSTANDPSSATYSTNYNANQGGSNRGIHFDASGTRLYVFHQTENRVSYHTLSTAWDISSASHQNSFNFNYGGQLRGGAVSPDGSKLYQVDDTNRKIYVYSMSTSWSVSSASLTHSYGPSGVFARPIGCSWNDDGSIFYVADYGSSTSRLVEVKTNSNYNLNAVSGYSYITVPNYPDSQNIHGLSFDGNFQYMFSNAQGNNTVYRYTVTGTGQAVQAPASGEYHIAITNSGGQIDSSSWTDINSMTADATVGNGEVYFAVSTDNHTSWKIANGSDGVRTIARNNSGTWQYNSDVGTANGHDLANATNRQSYSLTQTGEPLGIEFFNNGSNYIIVDNTNDRFYEYECSTAYDITTSSYTGTAYHFGSTISGDPPFVVFNGDGTKLYSGGNSNQKIHTFSMTTAYDISTINSEVNHTMGSSSFPIGGMRFNNDGTKMYTTQSSGTGSVQQWSLSTAYDVSTSTYDSVSFTPSGNSYSSNPGLEGLHFSSDGTKLYLAADNNDTIYYVTLSTAWDLSTASEQTFYDETTVGSASDYSIQDVYVVPNGTKLITINKTNDTLDMLDIGTISYSTSETWVNATTNDEFSALKQALEVGATNRMSKTELDAVTDAGHFTLGNSLDLMIAMYIDGSGTVPISDGVTINYDAQAEDVVAIAGTDYTYKLASSTSVSLTALSALNLKIRIV